MLEGWLKSRQRSQGEESRSAHRVAEVALFAGGMEGEGRRPAISCYPPPPPPRIYLVLSSRDHTSSLLTGCASARHEEGRASRGPVRKWLGPWGILAQVCE
jgi:hypothetical protein